MPPTDAPPARQLLSLHPVLFTADIPGTLRHYQDTLGFAKKFESGGPAFYAAASRDGIALHFRHLDSPPVRGERGADVVDVYITVADMDRLHSELVGRGAKVIYGPARQDYGMKEFYVEDCNGCRLAFGQQI
jgi:uncharacterized glyoxalase superfamily protein PhnB